MTWRANPNRFTPFCPGASNGRPLTAAASFAPDRFKGGLDARFLLKVPHHLPQRLTQPLLHRFLVSTQNKGHFLR